MKITHTARRMGKSHFIVNAIKALPQIAVAKSDGIHLYKDGKLTGIKPYGAKG